LAAIRRQRTLMRGSFEKDSCSTLVRASTSE